MGRHCRWRAKGSRGRATLIRNVAGARQARARYSLKPEVYGIAKWRRAPLSLSLLGPLAISHLWKAVLERSIRRASMYFSSRGGMTIQPARRRRLATSREIKARILKRLLYTLRMANSSFRGRKMGWRTTPTPSRRRHRAWNAQHLLFAFHLYRAALPRDAVHR